MNDEECSSIKQKIAVNYFTDFFLDCKITQIAKSEQRNITRHLGCHCRVHEDIKPRQYHQVIIGQQDLACLPVSNQTYNHED